jgi:hypothetical protein
MAPWGHAAPDEPTTNLAKATSPQPNDPIYGFSY